MLSVSVSGNATPYQNDDILPLAKERRTWTNRTFIYFWLPIGISLGAWSSASTSLATGLTAGQAITVCVISNTIIALAMFASGLAGSKWHIPFAVVNRTCWGLRGAWFVVLNRILLSCCWFGIEAWYGGQMVRIMIGAIWPSFHQMKNHLPASAGVTSNELLSFMIFWLLGLPLILLKPERYNRPALFTSVIVTIPMFVIFIWAIAKQGNAGPLWNSPEQTSDFDIPNSEVGWVMLWMTTRGIGSWASGILYQSDFTRYARRSGDQFIGQILIFPIISCCANIFGIITTSCARGFYPDEPLLWKLYDLLYAVQRHEGNKARVAVFFGAFAFFLSQMSLAVVATAIVGGIDSSALLPRYLNMRRGAYLVACAGVLIQPWRILMTAGSFIAALSGYAVFLSPLTGIMLTEYFIVRQRNIKLSHLYTPGPTSNYWFWHGLNLRAPIAFFLGVLPNIPGFAASINPGEIRIKPSWIRIYYMSWFVGLAISSAAWILLNKTWPPSDLGEVIDNVDDETETTTTTYMSSTVEQTTRDSLPTHASTSAKQIPLA